MYFTRPPISKLVESSDVIIFDMNGLIVDDEPLQLKATNILSDNKDVWTPSKKNYLFKTSSMVKVFKGI